LQFHHIQDFVSSSDICFGFQENIDKGAEEQDDTENMQIEDVITKYKDMNPKSTKGNTRTSHYR
jgi:hypothetical protein